jgi:peroxiredoxin
MPALATGKKAPDFSLAEANGGIFSLKQALSEGPVLLAFFKISCPVCQYTLPFIERIHLAYKGKNISVVGISQNDKKSTEQFAKQYGITFPLLLDDPGSYVVSNAYGLTNVPTQFLISPEGNIEVSSVGWSRADVEEMNQRLAEAGQVKAAPIFHKGQQVPDFQAG